MAHHKPTIALIVAISNNNAIGKNNQLLWHLPNDLRFFKRVTTGHSIIMGRKTFESIGNPLPNRRNIILSMREGFVIPGIEVAGSLKSALELTAKEDIVFVLGGAEIYKQFLPLADEIYLTQVDVYLDGDAFFPKLRKEEWQIISQEPHSSDERHPHSYTFLHLQRIFSEENE